jgi:hypothetical protein
MGDSLKDWESKGFQIVDGKLVPTGKKGGGKKPYNKYRNNRVEIDGIKFDSEKEGRFYTQLKLRKKAGEVKDFQRQVPFAIEVNGIHIAKYLLDFQVEYPDGRIDYIDIKAKTKEGKWITTDTFKLKKKLVEAIYKIEIKLV